MTTCKVVNKMFLELGIEINIGENASVLNVKSVGVLLIF